MLKTTGALAHAFHGLPASTPLSITVNGRAVEAVASVGAGGASIAIRVAEPKAHKKDVK